MILNDSISGELSPIEDESTGAIHSLLINVVSRNYDGSRSDSPQLGVLYIATILRDNRHPVSVLVGDELYNEVSSYFHAVGMKSTLLGCYTNSDNIFEVLRILSYAKEINASVLTILGGPLANVAYKSLIERDDVDFVAVGDGEYLMLELVQHLNFKNSNLSDITGLVWKQDGQVMINKSRPTFRELDKLPIPDRDLYPAKSFGVRSQIVTSRGCGFRCTFCFESTNRKYRAHSPRRVVDEIKYLQDRFGTRYFTFVDDIFTTDHKRVRKLCEAFHSELNPHKDFTFYCEARVDTLAKFPDLVPVMQEAGLVRIQIGTESGDQRVVDTYKKQIKLEDARTVVSQCDKAEVLSIFTNFIIGGALETEETLDATRQYAIELLELAPGRLECNTTFLSPYPGTDIALRPEAYEINILDPEFVTGLSDDHIFVETNALAKEKILEFERSFTEGFAHRMQEMLPKLPIPLLLRHLEMRKHGLATRWSDYISRDTIFSCLARFGDSQSYFGAARAVEIDDPRKIIPQRTFSLRSVKDGELAWMLRQRQFKFENFEYWIVEHCSGKIPVSEITRRAKGKWHFETPIEVIQQSIMTFLFDLSKEGLIVFRQIPA